MLEVNLGAQRLNTEIVEADAAEGETLRRILNSVSAEKEAIEQQLQVMSTLDELKDADAVGVHSAQGTSSSNENKARLTHQLRRDSLFGVPVCSTHL